jgi:hypothetical protein
MIVFAHDGSPGISGTWTGITASKSFDPLLTTLPLDATHYVRYSTGGTAALKVGELLTGGTSTKTCRLVAQAVEVGTAGSSDVGILFINAKSGTFQGETLTGGSSTGTVVIAQDFLPLIMPGASPKTCLLSVESASLNISLDGTLPTVAAGTNNGHVVVANGSYVIRGIIGIKNFKCINSVASSGTILKYTLFY